MRLFVLSSVILKNERAGLGREILENIENFISKLHESCILEEKISGFKWKMILFGLKCEK